MKILSFSFLLITVFLFTISTAFGQLKSSSNEQVDEPKQTFTLLTPEMFIDSSLSYDFYSFSTPVTKRQEHIPVFDNRINKITLLFSRSIIANKNDLKSTHTFSPFTVSEYNRQVRQQFFMAEPTSQQRRYLPPFRW
jgi:hypothetical protein